MEALSSSESSSGNRDFDHNERKSENNIKVQGAKKLFLKRSALKSLLRSRWHSSDI